MEVADSFIPTAGTVGLLAMVTYFFMLVAMFAFLGVFIVSVASCSKPTPDTTDSLYRLAPVFIAVYAAISGLTYYLIQFYYHDLLADVKVVSDAADRQTLIRESYNAIGQYRYMAWFITAPILLILIVSPLRLHWKSTKRLLLSLFIASLFMVFTSYIGHQQLSFDNEIQTGPKLLWSVISALAYGYILFTLYRLWKKFSPTHPVFRNMAGLFAGAWGVYFLGYFCTLLPIDFNWIHIVYTLTDLISQIGIGTLSYLTWSKAPK